MRVLMTADTIGGVWTYAVQLITALRGHGVEIALATMGAPVSDSQRRQAAALDNLTLFESHYRLEWMDDPWSDVEQAGAWLRDLEQDFRPDIVHLNGYAHGQQAFAAPVVIVAHSCCLSWWDAVKGETPPAYWERYRTEVAAGLAGAGLVIAPSSAMLAAIERWYAPPGPRRVIYNGRERGHFAPGPKQDYVLSVGRLWDEAKNLALLEQVAADVSWPIRVAGSTAGPDGGRSIRDGVRLLGVLDEPAVARQMNSAAIYAMPARYEPFGLSVLEAALSGCALVLGDIPSLREIWSDAAVYVDPTDPSSLRAALRRLAADPATRQAYGDAAVQRAGYLTAARMAQSYVDAYRQLLRPGRAASHLCLREANA